MNTTRRRAGTLIAAAATAPLLLAPLAPAASAATPTPAPRPRPLPTPTVTVGSSWQFRVGGQVSQGQPVPYYNTGLWHPQVPVRLTWSAWSRYDGITYDLYRHNPVGTALLPLLTHSRQTGFATTHTDLGSAPGPITRTLYPSYKLVATDRAGRSTTVDPIRRSPLYSEQETGAADARARTVFPRAPQVLSGWRRATGGDYDAGAALVAGQRGATVRIPVSTRAGQFVALEMTTGPRMGTVEVRVDGHRAGVVDTYARTRTPRVLVAQYRMTAGQHTVTLVNLGTWHRSTVELDGVFASD